ncbi:uncharacterized protein TNCV_1006191 [Trichonephila clavipes]|nr:uncharacterized protein TNCV_1006191 [Trichonephila clavipes]
MVESCLKKTLHAVHGAADNQRINKADINTPVVVDQHAANCLQETVWSFTAKRTRCLSLRSDVSFLRPLPVFRVVWYLSVFCFRTLTVELLRCTRTAIAQQKNPLLRSRRLDQVHEPKSPQEIVHQKRTGIDVLPFKSCTKQKMIWSCLYQIAFSTILVNFLA